MSKKKNKFKKKHQPHNSITLLSEKEKTIRPTGDSLDEVLDYDALPVKPAPENLHDVYKTDKYDHVKKDIKKILIIMAIIILALIGIYILSLKTTILSSFGDWVYKILNIQTG